MRLHREGRWFIIGGLLGTVVGYLAVHFWGWWGAPALALVLLQLLFSLQFFRVPKRKHTFGSDLITSPADGKVVVIEQVFESEFLKTETIQISVFMSPLNVHQNLAPIGGLVAYQKYHPGKYWVAWHPKSSTENERNTIVFNNLNGKQILVRQIAGAVARRICWYVKPSQPIAQNQEFGFIRFGSRVDVFVPLGTDIVCNIGDTVKGGVSVLAKV